MHIIKQNPFRLLGLTVNASEKQLQKQIGIIKRYAEVGKTKSFDYDFEFLGDFSRNLDDIQEASNSIEQSHKKLLYSLFWFVENNKFDEIAFNNLKEQKIEKAIEIWSKTLKNEITYKNYSSYLNLSTLYIALSTIDDHVKIKELQAGISLKGNLIHSKNLNYFSKIITGNETIINSEEISKNFVDEVIEFLKPYLNKRNELSIENVISLFSSFPTNIQKYVSTKFTEVPVSKIENYVDKILNKRKKNPENAKTLGEDLYKSTRSDITLLKEILGNEDIQYQMLANKLANEILQCAIDYFNYHIDSNNEFDPSIDALKIARYTENIDTSGQIQTRINENIKILQDWADTSEERKSVNRIKKYCWYCNKNLAEDDYKFETKMYKEVSRTGLIQKKVSYQKCTIKINRCSSCYDIHNKDFKGMLWLFIILYIISFILFYFYVIVPENDWGMILLFLLIGWLPAFFINLVTSSILESRYAKKFKIRQASDINEHPLVKEMFKENWSFTEPSA